MSPRASRVSSRREIKRSMSAMSVPLLLAVPLAKDPLSLALGADPGWKLSSQAS
jgi:hypothetical protein